jgi:hypothetical protein
MSRLSVRQIDIARAVGGARAAGLRVNRVEIDGAKITLITDNAPINSGPEAAATLPTALNPDQIARDSWADFNDQIANEVHR